MRCFLSFALFLKMLSYDACFLPIQLLAHGFVFMRRHVSRKQENVLSHMVGVTILKKRSR